MKNDNRMSDFLDDRGRCMEAEEVLGRLLASREQVLGSQHINIVQTQHRLARAYQMEEG
jgi:hypothetical protein